MSINGIKGLLAVLLLAFSGGCAAGPTAAPPEKASVSAASGANTSSASLEGKASRPEKKTVSQKAKNQKGNGSGETPEAPEENTVHSEKESSSLQEKTDSSTAFEKEDGALRPLTEEERASLEEYFLGFAEGYSIVTLGIPFNPPSDLTDAEKYTLFLFLQSRPREDGTSLEQELYSEQEQACVVPVSVVNEYLQEYLETELLKPELALEDMFSSPKYGYDPERRAFIVPALSGFGGYRDFALLDSELKEDTLTLSIGSFGPDTPLDTPPDERIRMRVKLTGLDPLRFQLLSWENF